MKVNHRGQARAITDNQVWDICSNFTNKHFAAIWIVTCYTGARINESLTLSLEDVFTTDSILCRRERECDSCVPSTVLTIRQENTKGQTGNRQIPIHRELRRVLLDTITGTELVFPSGQSSKGLSSSSELPYRRQSYDSALRIAAKQSKIAGIATHSGRRTFVTRLYDAGCDLRTIQSMTGHRNLSDLQLYIECGIGQREKAIAML
jgi:integrase/recombinase XerD